MELELEVLVDCESTANWRRQLQGRFPEDQRNARAAEILSSLAKQMPALEGSQIHERLVDLWQTKEGFGEIASSALRSVGFWSFPATALELLEGIADAATQAADLVEEPGC